jgi:hypothetical protein
MFSSKVSSSAIAAARSATIYRNSSMCCSIVIFVSLTFVKDGTDAAQGE